jgi:hypothetical protein
MTEKREACPDLVANLADHLCARRPCGGTPENVADWLDYSLNRCGLVVITEQKLGEYHRLVTRTPSPDTEAVEGLVERLRTPSDTPEVMSAWDSWRKYIKEGGGASWPRDAFECLLDNIDEERAEAADRIIALREAMGRQTALVDRLCSAVEREVEGIGGEGSLAVLRLIGPVNDEAIALLGGREALKLSEETDGGK